jgi:hypothetical protein
MWWVPGWQPASQRLHRFPLWQHWQTEFGYFSQLDLTCFMISPLLPART